MTSQLQKPLEPLRLDTADCVLTKNSLLIHSEPGFITANLTLANIDSCSQWWWGDLILYAEKHNLKTVLDDARADLHRSTLYSYVETARLFAPEDRHPDLTFHHHYAITYILGPDGTVEQGKKWLKRAAKEQLSVGSLREAMRQDQRKDENDPGPMRGQVRLTDFTKISRWAETVKTKDLPDIQAEEIRRSTGPLFQFLCELHRKPFLPA